VRATKWCWVDCERAAVGGCGVRQGPRVAEVLWPRTYKFEGRRAAREGSDGALLVIAMDLASFLAGSGEELGSGGRADLVGDSRCAAVLEAAAWITE